VDSGSNVQAPNLWTAFAAVAAAAPSSPALVLPDGTRTFSELHTDALRASAWLATKGYEPGQVVALHLTKAYVTYVLWLACLRRGLPYVFVDPRNPELRTAQILQLVRPALVATGDALDNPFGDVVRVNAETGLPWVDEPQDTRAPAAIHGLSPAYVMFTSGSTGEPKGAVIPHQGVSSLMRWARTAIPAVATQRFANVNPLHFDNSVFDLYCGLLNGAALVPVDTGNVHNPMLWVKQLRAGCATVLFAVPTLFQTLNKLRLLTPASLPDVRVFLFGGEGFPIEALREFHARFAGVARLINVYGPTETSCICSSLEITEQCLAAAGNGFASLGRMHPDFAYAVLDEQGGRVPPGRTGELWIGGANVGLGYYGSREESAQRFRQDPRHDDYRSIWYRSGDLVREDEQGLLWFQGRADNQVKVRGHRIELEEIDLAIQALPGIRRAVAVVTAGEDGPEIRAAFEGASSMSLEVVRAHCQARLAPYMQPATLVQMDALPVNANGKVDRRAARLMLERAQG
jgi:D-alanine--poly(phosphoribitol) ligase subunit 1